MAEQHITKRINITIKPGRKDHPGIPQKVVDNAFKEAAKTAEQEVKKYFDSEREPVEVTTTT